MDNENQISQELSDRSARPERAQRLINFLEFARSINSPEDPKILDQLGSEKGKRDFIGSITNQQFLQGIDTINGVIRGLPKDRWGRDGELVGLGSIMMGPEYLPPKYEYRDELLIECLDIARKMNEEERSLHEIGLVLYVGINAIHPYLDGNGRTSRILYDLFDSQDISALKNRLKESTDTEGRTRSPINMSELNDMVRWGLMAPSVGLRKRDGSWILDPVAGFSSPTEKLDQQFKPSVTEPNRSRFLELLKLDDNFLFLAVYKYFGLEGFHPGEVKHFKNLSRLEIDKLIGRLEGGQVLDILDTYDQLKKEQVLLEMDIIANPDNQQYRLKYPPTSNEAPQRIIDYVKSDSSLNTANQDRLPD